MRTEVDIGAWLRGLGLERYEAAFQEHEIDLELLPTLTADDLKDLGVTVIGHRRRLLNAIAALPGAGPPEAEPKPATTPPPSPTAREGTEAERRQLTVLFCDIVASTELAARLDPEDMSALIRRFQDCCTEVIRRWEGHIAKFTGDGVAVYFGYPKAYEDGAERAVRTGLELARAVSQLSTPVAVPLQVRVGIATGLVVVGDLIGEKEATERAVAGETPHLAARLQALATPGAVVIAPNTRRLLGGRFELTDLGPHSLKGFTEPVRAWQVLGESEAESRFEAMHQADLTPLVGREEELQLLLARWERAKEGDGQVVLLSGEAGIGKSRITQALAELVAREPCTRLGYSCSPYHVNSALHPIIEQLVHAAGLHRADSPSVKLGKLEAMLGNGDRQASAAAVALLAPLLSIPTDDRQPPIQLSPKQQKERTFDVLIDRVRNLAAQAPLLIVFEDAQWIDPSTGELLHLLVAQMQRLPILLAVTFRPEFVPPWTGYSNVTSLSLSRLSQRHAASLVEGLTGGRSLPDEVLSQILIKTDGVPLFVEELTKTVLESELLEGTGRSLALCGPWSPLSVPATLHDSLLARLDRLAPVKEVAQTGAVIGREFSRDLLGAVVQMPAEALDDALDQLAASELLFRRGGDGPQAVYTFKHALVRDTAYHSLLKRTRQHYHRQMGELIEARFPEIVQAQPELVAHHYTEAGQTEPAIEYWRRAGRRAAERSANGEAVAHLNRALSLLLTWPEGVERDSEELDLQIALTGPATGHMGYTAPETERVYTRALELCERVGESPKIFPVLFGWFSFYIGQGQAAKSLESAEEFLRRAERLDDSTFRMIGHRLVGTGSLMTGKPAPAIDHLERAIALYDLDRHRDLALTYAHDVKVAALCMRGLALWITGYPERAKVSADQGLDLAKLLSHATTMGYAQVIGGVHVHSLCRDERRVRGYAETALAFSEKQGLPFWGATAKWAMASVTTEPIPSEAELAAMRQALAALEALRWGLLLPVTLGQLAEACGRAGNRQEAKSALDRARAIMRETGERLAEAELHRIEGDLRLLADSVDRARAEACYRRAIEVARRQEATSWELRAATSLARLWRDHGKRAEAHDLLAPLYGWFTEGFDTRDLVEARALLEELR